MREATVVLERGGAGPSSPTLATTDLARGGYRRLSVVAAAMGGGSFILAVVWLLESLASGFPVLGSALWATLSVFVVSVGVAAGASREWFPARLFVPITLATEVGTALCLSLAILGWQHRQGPDTISWLIEGGTQPLSLGGGEVPWVGLWIILFATVIPLQPRQHLVGALLSITPLAFVPFVSVWLTGLPPELQSGGLVSAAHVAVWLTFRGALAAGMAYAAARSVNSLRKRVAHARRMGSYQLQEKLGAGGMGEVWKADHHMLARPAAIKLILPQDGEVDGTDALERFEREVQATAQLRSPHTIEIYDYGLTEDGTFYYAMELLDGLDLEQLVEEGGPIQWQRAVHILGQVCHSLGEAHARGVVHRDIKPANIFLCRIGRDLDQIKVLDFGLVKARAQAIPKAELTQQGAFVGTPAYAAPEIAMQIDTTDPRSDLYALGAVAFWLLTGRRVFAADNALELLFKHAKESPPAPSDVTELEVPPDLDRIVLDCLAKDPESRPGSADDLVTRLEGLDGVGRWTSGDAAEWWTRRRPETGQAETLGRSSMTTGPS